MISLDDQDPEDGWSPHNRDVGEDAPGGCITDLILERFLVYSNDTGSDPIGYGPVIAGDLQ